MTAEKLKALVLIGGMAFLAGYVFTYNCGNWPETEHLAICHKR